MTQSQISLNAKSREVRQAAAVYLRANAFLNVLRGHLDVITMQEFRTLRVQALHGDIEGAEKGLHRILTRVRA